MDRQRYLKRTYVRIQKLVDDQVFKNDLAQVRARAIQEELLPEQPEVDFNFDPKKIWKYCDYIFSESAMLLRENYGDRSLLLESIRTPAEAFEFLARFTDEDEKEILLLSSAMCYHIAGYQANAQCLANMVEKKYLPDKLEDALANISSTDFDLTLAVLFRYALVSFLKRDISRLRKIIIDALSTIQNLQETVTRGITEQELSITEVFNLTAHAYFQRSLSDFVQYCLKGNSSHFSDAYENIKKSHGYFQRTGDVTFGTITSELRTVFDLFNHRSIWTNMLCHAGNLLDNRIWQAYLRNLAFEKSIVEFWSSQLKAMHNGLLTSKDSFVVQMPTSAGKTLIAELSILAALTLKDRARCLYIAPYRALANEIESNLAKTLGAVGYQVSKLIGSFEFDTFQDFLTTQADVLVATPEKVELLLRTHPEYFEHLSVIVVDEGHIIDEGVPSSKELGTSKTLLGELENQGTLGRGALLELLITRLKHREPDARFIFLSAVMPDINADDFVEWLCENRQDPLHIDPTERPSRQLIVKFKWRSSDNGELEYISLPKLPNGRHPFVPYFIQRRQYPTGELTATGRQKKRSWPDMKNKSQTTAMLAVRFAKSGPVLVFCAETGHVKTVIDHIITSIKYLDASKELSNDMLKYSENPVMDSFHLAQQWLGKEHLLTTALHYSVGLHYGPLPEPVRQAIEDDFRNDKIRILVSTNTLAQGVNLPIKTAIIYSLERRWMDNGIPNVSPVKKRDFWNICGRAGRAAKETEGQVIFVVNSVNPGRDERLLGEYRDRANLEPVNSALYKLLLALIDKRISQDDLIGYLDAHILGILAEEIVDTQDEEEISKFLKGSLVGIQALRNNLDIDPLVSSIKSVSAWVIDNVPDRDSQRIFASTGLRLKSCKSLEDSVDVFYVDITEELLKAEEDKLSWNEDLLIAAFRACQDLPEMMLKRNVSYKGIEDEFEIIKAWVSGRPINSILSDFWGGDSESLSEYIADRVVYKLPWGINGFLRILAFKLGRDYEKLPRAWQHLPSMLKFGVGDVVACWASSLGVSSRELALQLAAKYQYGNHVASFRDFTKWVVNLPTGFLIEELECLESEKQKLADTINRIMPDREHLEFIRSGSKELRSPVRGIRYAGRQIMASKVREGDHLILEAEPDNPHDQYAIKVVFHGEPIGYVQRDKAKIVSREMELGREVKAWAEAVYPPTDRYPFTSIEMRIVFE